MQTTVQRFRPGEQLAQFVECFWWSQREVPEEVEEHVLPSGKVQMVIPLGTSAPSSGLSVLNRSAPASLVGVIHGVQSRFYLQGAKAAGIVLGVSFRPGCAGAVLGVPAHEFANLRVGLDNVWGARGVDLRDQLLEAQEPLAVFRVLERCLVAGLQPRLVAHRTVADTLGPAQRPRCMKSVYARSGYSARHFIALFRSAVGLPPKEFFRIRRFNEVAIRLASCRASSISDIAAQAGYADQAHLTREFRDLAGVTPTHYEASADRPLHHRPGLLRR
jgi:AraC-like DNA-binding protein